MPTLDMTDGVYRRIYSGFLDNPKINAVSWQAEAWFWRLVVSADDFGNIRANWRHLAVNASPVRELSGDQAKGLTMELAKAKLVSIYEVDGTSYVHIEGFTRRQPANKNGRRIQRFPMNPDESGCALGNAGESGGIQNNPGESSPSDSDSDSDSDSKSPQPPKGGGGDEIKQVSPADGKRHKATRTRKATEAATLAQVAYVFEGRGFAGVEFANALEAFYGHRNEIGHPMTLRAASAMVTQFANLTEREATECLVQSVANGWRGVFPEKVRRSGPAAVAAANRGGGSSIDSVIAEAQRLRELEERRTA